MDRTPKGVGRQMALKLRNFLSSFLFPSLFISFMLAVDCQAKVVRLFAWQSADRQITLIMPKVRQESRKQTINRFKKNLVSATHYRSLLSEFKNDPSQLFAPFVNGTIRSLIQTNPSFTETIRFAVVANRPAHLNPKGTNYSAIVQSFSKAGADIYVIPFGIETILTPKELLAYHQLISKNFPALLATGGADLDPALYSQRNTHSDRPNFMMDKVETRLIKRYTEKSPGVFYGICRGHQSYVIATGGTLFQDLSLLRPNLVKIHAAKQDAEGNSKSSWHDITLVDTKNALFEAVGKRTFLVNSRHHQSVKSIAEGRVIALESEKVIEGIEKRDSKGRVRVLTVQFHPEDMNTLDSERIIHWMVQNAQKVLGR